VAASDAFDNAQAAKRCLDAHLTDLSSRQIDQLRDVARKVRDAWKDIVGTLNDTRHDQEAA
jgi:hypothetical protein